MIKSMTGYGKVNFSDDRYDIEIELRSVNSRYLDLKIHAPREMNNLENAIRNVITDHIKRGKVDLMIRFKDYSPPQLELDKERLKAFWKLYQEASEAVGSEEPLSLKQIMNEKGIINLKDNNNESLKGLLLENIKKVLKDHKEMALKEGEAMLRSLQEAVEICHNSLKSIEKTIPQHKQQVFQTMQDNIALILGSKLDENDIKRLMLEVSIYIDKSDITEELIRFKDHLEKFYNTLKDNKISVGKSLNFILQEMHREINTIGSKFNTKESYDQILTIKEEIEKCREIVQNVE